MKKIILSLLLATSCLSNVYAQTFKFEQYNLDNFNEFLGNIKPNHKYYFDLDNTLIVINDYKYGSDGWTDVVSKAIKEDEAISKELKNDMLLYLFDGLTPENFYKLKSTAVKDNYASTLNRFINKPNYFVNGLTSRSNNVQRLTENNLKSAGYNENLNVYYTTGGNKGNYIYNVYNNEGTNKITEITYVDDTYKKLTDAYETMKILFNGQKDVKITLVHLKNTMAKNYKNDKDVTCDFSKTCIDDLLLENCSGNNKTRDNGTYYLDFKEHYFSYKVMQNKFIKNNEY